MADKPKEVEGLEPTINQSVFEALETIQKILQEKTEVSDKEKVKQTNELNLLSESVNGLESDLSDIKTIQNNILTKKVNPRKRWEAVQDENDSLYNQCVVILDDVVSRIEGVFPEYQYINSSITHFSEDGNVLDGVINIGLQIDDFYRNRKYQFEVPIYILEGFVYEPLYFTYNNEPHRFIEETIGEIIGSRDKEPEYLELYGSMGTTWSNMNKTLTAVGDTKVPFQKSQKNYHLFPMKHKEVSCQPKPWHIFNKPDMAPSIIENMTSPPNYYNQFEYSLLY